jgi:hypothetical protein
MRTRNSRPFLTIFPRLRGAAWTLSLVLAAAILLPRSANADLIALGTDGENFTFATAGATSTVIPLGGQVPTNVLQNVNDPNMVSISRDGNSGLSEVFGLGENFSGSSHSNGFATAEYGSLHAFAHAVAQVFPSAYAPPGPGPFGPSPYYAVAQAGFGAGFTDTVTLGGSLAAGTPIQFLYTFQFDSILNPRQAVSLINVPIHGTIIFQESLGTAENPTLYSGQFISSDETGTIPLPSDPNGPEGSFDGRLQLTISAHAGDVLLLSENLDVSAFAHAGNIVADAELGSGFQEQFADASNTAVAFLDPITPGLTIVSAIGHDYSTPSDTGPGTIPEPSTLALAGIGLALVAAGLVRKRMKPTN